MSGDIGEWDEMGQTEYQPGSTGDIRNPDKKQLRLRKAPYILEEHLQHLQCSRRASI